MNRRKFIRSASAMIAANTVAAAGPLLPSAFAQTGPIRIGLLAPLTGVVAAGGKEMVEGFNLYWDQHGRKIAGRDIEIIVEDDASNPDTALQKARRLVEQRNVHMLIGDLLANTGLAVAEYVKGNGVPYFIPIIAADDLTQRKRIPNVIRIAG
jgi:branched-chain amino acid transport system substrate-binding protein